MAFALSENSNTNYRMYHYDLEIQKIYRKSRH